MVKFCLLVGLIAAPAALAGHMTFAEAKALANRDEGSSQVIAGSVDTKDQSSSQRPVRVAPLFGAYAYLSRTNSLLLRQQMDSHQFFPEFESFEKALGKIGGEDLINEVGFVAQEFVVPSDQVGFDIDLRKLNKDESGLPSYALAITPKDDDGRVFFILAMQSPARVTIFWMDKTLNGAMIYDSYKADVGNDVFEGTPFESISSLKVSSHGAVTVVEFVKPRSYPTSPPRIFKLSLAPDSSLSRVNSKVVSR